MKSEDEIIKTVETWTKHFPETLVVLGSGWNKVLDKAQIETEIKYADLFGVAVTVPGHAGKLIIAKVKGKRTAFMSGRIHTYEGYNSFKATTPIRVFGKCGVKKLIITAACGALNEKYKVGDFVILNDVITLFLALDNPLIGPKFIDMSRVFNQNLIKEAKKVASINNINFHEGSYVYYHGPNYETPADKMALRFLGADIVGMSTVPEVIVARSLNIDILGLAFVTNLAFVKHDHKEVVNEANKASFKMITLLEGIISNTDRVK